MGAEIWIYKDGDLELRGEVYRPSATANGAAVLVVHEADGIGGNVREHCARLAELGYVAAAADMHGGGRVLEGAEMVAALDAFRADPACLRRRVRAGLDALHSYTNHAVVGLGDPRMAYDPVAHRLSWAALTTFLEVSLQGPVAPQG